MAVSKQKVKKKRRLSSMSGAMLAITFVVMLLLLAMVISGFCLQKKITSNNSRMEDLQKQIESEKQRTEEIEEEEQYMQSDEYLEQTAKEKLGFVKDGEIIFKENK